MVDVKFKSFRGLSDEENRAFYEAIDGSVFEIERNG